MRGVEKLQDRGAQRFDLFGRDDPIRDPKQNDDDAVIVRSTPRLVRLNPRAEVSERAREIPVPAERENPRETRESGRRDDREAPAKADPDDTDRLGVAVLRMQIAPPPRGVFNHVRCAWRNAVAREIR